MFQTAFVTSLNQYNLVHCISFSTVCTHFLSFPPSVGCKLANSILNLIFDWDCSSSAVSYVTLFHKLHFLLIETVIGFWNNPVFFFFFPSASLLLLPMNLTLLKTFSLKTVVWIVEKLFVWTKPLNLYFVFMPRES